MPTPQTEELVLPLEQEAEAHLDALAIATHGIETEDGYELEGAEQMHKERLERLLADSERMVIGIGRAYVRDGRRLEALDRQRALMEAEFDALEAPIRARRKEAEAFLQRIALVQREHNSKDTTLTIPTVGKVTTKRTPANFKVTDPELTIRELLDDEHPELAPFEEPKEPERKLDTAAFKRFLADQVEVLWNERAGADVAAHARMSDDQREQLKDELRREVAALYQGVTLEPTKIGATIEVRA